MKTLISFLPKAAAYFFILLFCYAAVSKLLDYENFQVQLAQSPLLSAYADTVAWAVIAAELFIVILLAFPATLRAGLYASFGLMLAFTVYIYLILNYSDFVPCSCGGILEKMGWTEHLIFNAAAVLLSIVGIWATYRSGTSAEFQRMRFTRPAIILLLIAFFSTAVMIALFLSSEYIIKKENNFTRRFPHHPVLEDKILDLGVNSYYFVGIHNEKIYLANTTSPFSVSIIDVDMDSIEVDYLQPDRAYKYRMLKHIIMNDFYYVYDGSVPVIYEKKLRFKSNIINQISYKQAFFEQLIPINRKMFVVKTKRSNDGNEVFATLDISNNNSIQIKHPILDNQYANGFETDGRLLYDKFHQNVYYMFYYNNNILKMDTNLNMINKIKTIDTVSTSSIKSIRLKDGSSKMSAPPIIVNKSMTVHKGLIFNRSNLLSKNESRALWNNNAVVDIYNTNSSEYWGSFYIQSRDEEKLSHMLVTDQYLFVLSGNKLIRYRLSTSIINQFKEGEAEKPL